MATNSKQDLNGGRTPEQLFPDRQEDIRRLRAQDQVFEEICSDYELIAGIAQKETPEDEAVSECLAGLANEIRRALARSDRGADTEERTNP
ncbi:hypothetical protein [Aliiruegeria sabulilitoris]|uniref:hypothetical protein n=1 Tax=Aliiruegeria sabulilitoris TaxID=1510458 RepID=UPI0008329F1A|nr:hypothetical protein [Aliiruegeria sabulilitoris]